MCRNLAKLNLISICKYFQNNIECEEIVKFLFLSLNFALKQMYFVKTTNKAIPLRNDHLQNFYWYIFSESISRNILGVVVLGGIKIRVVPLPVVAGTNGFQLPVTRGRPYHAVAILEAILTCVSEILSILLPYHICFTTWIHRPKDSFTSLSFAFRIIYAVSVTDIFLMLVLHQEYLLTISQSDFTSYQRGKTIVKSKAEE